MKRSKRQEGYRIQPNADIASLGKIPPQAKEVEEVILGAMMLEKNAIDVVLEILNADCFYVETHKIIFNAMCDLNSRNIPIEIISVIEKLKSTEELDAVGGPFTVTKLTNQVTSTAGLENNCRIVFQKYLQREIIRIGQEMVISGFEQGIDAFELLEDSERNIMGLSLNNLKGDYTHIETGIVEVVKRIEELRHRESVLTGVPSGFTELDACTYGWQDTDLIILAARPAVGKTAFALNLARNAAMDPVKPTPVAYFSLEMSRLQLVQRMLSAETDIWLDKIRNGKMDDSLTKQLYNKGASILSQAPIYIDDTAGLNIYQVKAKARRMKKKHNIGMVIIDYLQLMSGDKKSGNREQEISTISRDLKGLAKDLGVPIIALSQLSRDIEKRGNKEPQLSDLRESGAIEQDADMVMFLYRPSKEDELRDADLKGKGTVKIAKHRNGTLEDIVLRFKGEVQRWEDLKPDDMGSNWSRLPKVEAPKSFYEKDDEPF